MARSNSPETEEEPEQQCPACRGMCTEFRSDEPCRECHGEGVVLNLARP